MAGHSKWSNIKHRKAAVDAKKGKAFTKVVRLINAAVRQGGGEPEMNPSLRLAIEKARAVNMPKDNIERAIKKAAGEGGSVQYEELTYEGYAAGGVAIIAEALTDNGNRTTPEVRKIFEKAGGNLGEMGCVNWMFKRVAMITLDSAGKSEDEWMEVALECGADDLELDEQTVIIKSEPESMSSIMDELRSNGYEPTGDTVSIAENSITVDVELANKVIKLMDAIEEHDDIQNVFSNMDIPKDVQEALHQA